MSKDVLHTNYCNTISIGEFNLGYINRVTTSTIKEELLNWLKQRLINHNYCDRFKEN